jgi:hypothetical protein
LKLVFITSIRAIGLIDPASGLYIKDTTQLLSRVATINSGTSVLIAFFSSEHAVRIILAFSIYPV